jgi:flagellar hook-associated protein 1 FlgK
MATAGLSNALYIGTSGMQLASLGLSTVSQNVVNSNTEGYSRQVMQTASSSVNGFGNGVQLSTIQRMSDKYLAQSVRTSTSDLAYSNTRVTYLNTIDGAITNASSEGSLETIVTNLVGAYNDLANDPANSSLRRTVVQNSSLVADTLNGISDSLTTVANNADDQITTDIATINQCLKDIYSLNSQIAAQANVANGANSNDLQDQRDKAITQLSGYMKLNVTDNTSNGAMRITTENGRVLVDEASYVQMTRINNGSGYQDIGTQTVKVDGTLNSNVSPLNTSTFTSGELKSLIDIRDKVVPDLRAQLDEFSKTFANTINDITSQGTSSPAVNSLTSGSTGNLASTSADLLTDSRFSAISGATFNISVVDSNGNPINTTVGGTPITVSPTAPATTVSLDDIAAAINNSSIGNATLGGTGGVIATTGSGPDGPYITITAANSSSKVVLANSTGNALGLLGMNNIFTGSTAHTIAVKPALEANPDLLPVSQMRTTDGGLSSTDNKTALQLAKLSTTKVGFSSAGSLGSQNDTLTGYLNQVVSNLAVTVSDAKARESYNESIKSQSESLASSVSGVNVNEELSTMLIYQNSFQASARIISVVNDMMQTLMQTVS